ncbi:MAG: hypothetical protein LBN20_06320, partial [Endomicrobium sp.]|nr:hypothetical protein [Endomicrobium sp.]
SKRTEVGGRNAVVEKSENTIQNIILQEVENLDGILIATTNLTQNLDKAFERRFIYKIEFHKPSLDARKHIWQSIIPTLSDTDAQSLSHSYDFSGGQIENIARKRTVDNIISGEEPNLDKLISFCNEEMFDKSVVKKIGFAI